MKWRCLQGKRGATCFLEACEQNNVSLVIKLMSIPDVDIAMPTVRIEKRCSLYTCLVIHSFAIYSKTLCVFCKAA